MELSWRRLRRLIADRPFAPFLGMGIAVGGLILLLGYFSYRALSREEALVSELARQRGENLISALESSLQAGMRMSWGEETLQALAEEMGRGKEIAYVAVVNEAGKVIAHSDRNLAGQTSPALARLAGSSSPSGSASVQPVQSALLFARRLRPRPPDVSSSSREEMMMPPQETQKRSARWLGEAQELTVVAAIRVGEFEGLRRQARRQTFMLALVVGLLLAGAVYVGFVVQGYQLARSNLRRLEQVRNVLSKFVPSAVVRLLEREPAAALEKTEQDATVLFLDLAGYTSFSEALRREELNALVERYFARFLDHVHRHGGDVTETAGDGLMVLFRDDNPSTHPRAAARAALDIRRAAEELNALSGPDLPPVRVNIGINTGPSLVGSTKIRGSSGERWTFTATGLVTNVAARLCAQATGGEVLLGPETAARLGREFPVEALGERHFKNVSAPVPIFRLAEEGKGLADSLSGVNVES